MVSKIGTVTSESSNFGRVAMTPVIGCGSATLIAPQASCKANLYGMVTASPAACDIHGPYDWIKSEWGL